MGKAFKSELLAINDTFKWASMVDIEQLEAEISDIKYFPLITVGSGGSLSACYFASSLHQSKGQISKPVTPLELINSKSIINSSSLLFLSASGRNTDILTSFKNSIGEEPKNLLGLVFSKNSPLKKLFEEIPAAKIYEYKSPVGKDGFLATNSLIGFFTILYRAYGNEVKNLTLILPSSFDSTINDFVNLIDRNFTFQVLFSGISQPVAIDIESKFSEAALANVLYSDYRNFGHGRHHWLNKRANTCIIALITPNDKNLANKTLELVPDNIPVLRLESFWENHFAAIDLLNQSFHLANKMGELQNVDPGRPGIPEFGRRLYHLKYASTIKKSVNEEAKIAIQRKLGTISIYSLDETTRLEWNTAYNNYKESISKKDFSGLILDYDGTLCSSQNRRKGLTEEMADILNNILKNDILIGIATGRGKSIRRDLQKVIKEDYQEKVIIGYYNGAEIGKLRDDSIPIKSNGKNKSLEALNVILLNKFPQLKTELKKNQLTIAFTGTELRFRKSELIEIINVQAGSNLLCVESSHSIDVLVKPDSSKLNVLHYFNMLMGNNGAEKIKEILCIGDKGRFPGNDFELLSHYNSLSVDEVSRDKNSCWNFSPSGLRQIDSTLYYMNSIKLYEGHFQIKL